MTIRRRNGLTVAAVAGALLVVSLFLVPVLLDADRYRPQVISYLEKSTGKKVTIGRLVLTVLPKLTIRVDELEVKSPPLFPPSDILKVTRIDARIDPWALLHRHVVIESLRLEHPVITLISDPDGPWNFENPGVKDQPNSLRIGVISRVAIRHGQITVSNLLPSDAPGPVYFEAHDVSSELQHVNPEALIDPEATTLDGTGTLQAASLRFGTVTTAHLSSSIRLQGRAISFTNVKAETYGGSTTGELAIRLSGKNPSFQTDAIMKRIDVSELLSAYPQARGIMTGKMDGKVRLAGDIQHSIHPLEDLHGSAQLTVRDGQVPSLKLNANLMKLAHYNDLGPAKDDPSSFKLISTDLELDHARISSKVIDIDGYGVDVDGSGSIILSGSGELNYQGVATILSEQGFVTNLFARMAGGTLKDGKLRFPFHVGGTLANPGFSKGN